MSVFETLQKDFPVRNTPQQKQAFRDWVLDMAEKAGKQARVEELDGHANILIGDPERAELLFTAHYDTPKSSLFPNLMLPCSPALGMTYAIGTVILLLVIPALAAAWGVFRLVPLDYSRIQNRFLPLLAFYVVYMGLFLLLFKGRINPHNANDNTSGTAVVLELMNALPDSTRAALILFDDEEKGKKGSAAFAKAHERIKRELPVINFDCVGSGDHFVFIKNKTFTLPDASLKDAFGALPNARFVSGPRAKSNSDQLNFDQGFAVVACSRTKQGLLYTSRIHTPRDTEVNERNLILLRDAALRLSNGK